MVVYLEKAKDLLRTIPTASIEVVPQSENGNINALANLASIKDAKLFNMVSVKFLTEPSIK